MRRDLMPVTCRAASDAGRSDYSGCGLFWFQNLFDGLAQTIHDSLVIGATDVHGTTCFSLKVQRALRFMQRLRHEYALLPALRLEMQMSVTAPLPLDHESGPLRATYFLSAASFSPACAHTKHKAAAGSDSSLDGGMSFRIARIVRTALSRA